MFWSGVVTGACIGAVIGWTMAILMVFNKRDGEKGGNERDED